MDRSQRIGVGVVAAVAVSGAVWFSSRAPEPPPITLVQAAVEQATITVHVTGAVAAPGLVELSPGARAADAIAAAGGALPGAALGAVNLAAPLVDGQHLGVPQAPTGSTPGERPQARVPVNTASVSDLESLPGVGPVLARRIIEYRDQHGPFGALEDLLDVSGIGEAKLAMLREAVQVP
jgi:competence protein ComEA